nr:unnamed protein product [Spirometra erinaceieuropaei]
MSHEASEVNESGSCTASMVSDATEQHKAEEDYLRFPRALYEAVRLWTNEELDSLIFALETDSLLTPSELMKFLPSKNAAEVLLIVLHCFLDRFSLTSESSIDIFRNSVRFAVDDQFSPAKQIVSALRELADKEGEKCFPTPTSSGSQMKTSAQHQARPDFSQIYKFLASLFTPGKPMELEPCNSAVIFDTLVCLTTVVGRIMSQLPTDPELSDIVRGLTEKMGDLLGMLAVARNCMHVLRGWGDAKSKTALPAYRRSVKHSRPNILPCPAVICVLQEADLPEGYALNRQLCTLLRNIMERSWQFPTSDDNNSTELPRQSLENYILNPLGVPTGEVPAISLAVAWQNLLTLFYQQCILPFLSPSQKCASFSARAPDAPPKTDKPKETPPAEEEAPANDRNRGLVKRRKYTRMSGSYRRLGMQVTKEDIDAHITTTFILKDCAPTFMSQKRPRSDNDQP